MSTIRDRADRASGEELQELMHVMNELGIRDKAAAGALYGYGVRTRADLLALNGLDMERLRIACGLEFETALTLLAKLSEIEAQSVASLVQAKVLPRGHEIDLPLPRNKEGCPALVHAASTGDTEGVMVLLDARADVDAKDAIGRTALFRAAGGGRYQICVLLLEAKANPAAHSQAGETPLATAAQHGHPSIVACLLSTRAVRVDDGLPHRSTVAWTPKDFDSIKRRTIPALYTAAKHGHLAVAQLLLKNGANVNGKAPASGGATALLVAAQNGHSKVVKALLGSNAAIEARLESGATALVVATQYGHGETVKELLALRAEANVETKRTLTPLLAAVAMGSIEIVEMLLQAGADKHRETAFGTVEELAKNPLAIQNKAIRRTILATLKAYD